MLVKIVILIITRWNHNLNYDCITRRSCYKYQFCCDKYVFVTTNTWHVFVTTKYIFCRDKSMLVVTKLWLSQQNILVIFWSYMSRQNTSFVETKLSCIISVATKLLSWQNCHHKRFVMTSILLSQQKTCFVTTKITLWGSSHQRQ